MSEGGFGSEALVVLAGWPPSVRFPEALAAASCQDLHPAFCSSDCGKVGTLVLSHKTR